MMDLYIFYRMNLLEGKMEYRKIECMDVFTSSLRTSLQLLLIKKI